MKIIGRFHVGDVKAGAKNTYVRIMDQEEEGVAIQLSLTNEQVGIISELVQGAFLDMEIVLAIKSGDYGSYFPVKELKVIDRYALIKQPKKINN